jgi:hypothetical protein
MIDVTDSEYIEDILETEMKETLSEWNRRTLEIVEKYGLESFRLDAWNRMFRGNNKGVELEYLRHIGQKLCMESLDLRQVDYRSEEAINTSKESVRIFLLFEELDTTQAYQRRLFVKNLREGTELYLSVVANE